MKKKYGSIWNSDSLPSTIQQKSKSSTEWYYCKSNIEIKFKIPYHSRWEISEYNVYFIINVHSNFNFKIIEDRDRPRCAQNGPVTLREFFFLIK